MKRGKTTTLWWRQSPGTSKSVSSAQNHGSRRSLFKSFAITAGACFLGLAYKPRSAKAIGQSSAVTLGVLELGGEKPVHPSALSRLSREIDKRTSITVALDPVVINLDKDTLGTTPILYLSGTKEFPVPSVKGIAKLRRFLTFGGFLIIDSAEGRADGAFDRSVRALIKALYPQPGTATEILSKEHVVFRSFYLLNKAQGRLAISAALEGVIRDERLQIVYTKNDMGGAWARDDFGNWLYPCEPGGETQREMSFRLGINLVMYALCLDYKADQVHVDFVMRKRQWRPNDGAEVPDSEP